MRWLLVGRIVDDELSEAYIGPMLRAFGGHTAAALLIVVMVISRREQANYDAQIYATCFGYYVGPAMCRRTNSSN